jgi:hypothetical protein
VSPAGNACTNNAGFFVLSEPVDSVFFCAMNEKTISGSEAVCRARNLKFVPDAYFTLLHLTCNFKANEYGVFRKFEHCRVRSGLKEDTFRMGGDMYFPFEDLDSGENKMCPDFDTSFATLLQYTHNKYFIIFVTSFCVSQ